jgi:hypothetical protein
MGIAQMAEKAVMPFQALVDFFAPQTRVDSRAGANASVRGEAPSRVYWARERLAQRAACSVAGHTLTRPVSQPVARISRTGFTVSPARGAVGTTDPQRFKPVRMRRSQDAAPEGGGRLAGRMVIAGRMRDVCAALDGLAD